MPLQPVLVELERPGPEQEIDDVALVRLQPVELDRRHRADVQPVDVRRVEQGRWNFASSVMAEHTRVGPIDSSIFSCGHSTTVQNGNMYSFLAIARLRRSQWITVGRR